MNIKRALEQGQGDVKIKGWIYRERKSNKFIFLVVRDTDNIVQCVIKKDQVNEILWEQANKILIETSVEIEGEIKKDERAPTGYEITVNSLNIVGEAENFPITKDQSPEFLLDNRHLWVRSRRLNAIFKIRHTIFQAVREYFNQNQFHETHSPCLTPNACEGGATLFEVKYFNDKVYLTQTWQLYAEALIYSLEKIYTIAPAFRAEKSKTSRHLAEFWMAEMEMAWGDLNMILDYAEGLIEFVIKKVLENNQEELKVLERDTSKLEKIKKPFKRITYKEALEILKKDGLEVEEGKDLRTIEEDKLMEHFDKPVIITNYPKEIMAFYKPEDPNNPGTALCFDMLAPDGYGEIIGGSQREENIKQIKKYLEKEGEDIINYGWYLDLRKYGNVPHAGFGMGMERIIAWVCGLDNIKETIPFPRTMLRKSP